MTLMLLKQQKTKKKSLTDLDWITFIALTRINQYLISTAKAILHFFLEIGSFYNSPRFKLLSFTIIESIQPISGSGGTTFSIA